MSACTAVRVVVPARDEEILLPGCLRTLAVAVARLAGEAADGPDGHAAPLDAGIVLVLDRCTDRSAAVARSVPGVDVLEVDAGSVGSARDLGARRALASCAAEPRHVWLAMTDADSQVPASWLTGQLDHARAGADLVVGTVEPDVDVSPHVLARWRAAHDLREGHPHVHGANLGIRGDAYLAAGGFRAWACEEDVDLVARVTAAGRAVARTDRGRVRTSARLLGRAPGGFAAHLRRLALPEEPTTLDPAT